MRLFLKIIMMVLILFLVPSCKLFQDKDTSAPLVNLTIEGGNEISREVTLYLDIEDDSKIDYVDIMINDTTAVTVTSNFDTIRFDVTPFADESEHQLYAKVADAQGNIGESEKLDVVITEFPGWRMFKLPNELEFPCALDVDESGNVLIGAHHNYLFSFSSINNDWSDLSIIRPDKRIADIKFYSDSRFYFVSDEYLIQYSMNSNSILSSVRLPNSKNYCWTLAIDKNYDIWIGTLRNGIYHYKGEVLNRNYKYDIPIWKIYDITISNDNTVFVSCDEGVVFSISNGEVTDFSDYNVMGAQDLGDIVVDHNNNLWIEGGYYYNGSNWQLIEKPKIDFYPLYITSSNYLITNDMIRGLVAYDGENWLYFDEFDSPFTNAEYISNYSINDSRLFAEAPNGDIWMVAGEKLMRYRPSLGGYP